MTTMAFGVPQEQIERFCRRWKIDRLSVFGSAAAGELRPDSDLDLLVTSAQEANCPVP